MAKRIGSEAPRIKSSHLDGVVPPAQQPTSTKKVTTVAVGHDGIDHAPKGRDTSAHLKGDSARHQPIQGKDPFTTFVSGPPPEAPPPAPVVCEPMSSDIGVGTKVKAHWDFPPPEAPPALGQKSVGQVATDLQQKLIGLLTNGAAMPALSAEQFPKQGADKTYRSPDGEALIRIPLRFGHGVAGRADTAYVNPNKNEFVIVTSGGLAKPTGVGPRPLPDDVKFSGATSDADIAALQASLD